MTASHRPSHRIPHQSHLLFGIVAMALACGGQSDLPLEGAGGSGDAGPLSNAGTGGAPPSVDEEGAGEFESCELVTVGLIKDPPAALTNLQLARFNSDGYLDGVAERLACCADTPDVQRNIYVFTGAADGALSLLTTLELDDPPVTASLADLNGDALDDILAKTPNRVVPFINDGASAFAAQPSVDTTHLRSDSVNEYSVGFLRARDFNEDGFADLAFHTGGSFGSSVPEQVHVLLGDGLGGYSAPVTTVLPARDLPDSELPAAPPEVNNNDFMVSDHLLVSRGDGSFDVTQRPAAAERGPIDINGDDSLDRWEHSDGTLRLYLGNDDGSIPAEPTKIFDASGWARVFVQQDLNGDGRRDIVILDRPGARTNPYTEYDLIVHFGRSDGTFAGAWSRHLTFYSASVGFSDVNGDGREELLISGLGGTGHSASHSYTVDCSAP